MRILSSPSLINGVLLSLPLLFTAIVCLILGYILVSLLLPWGESWQHVIDFLLKDAFLNTLFLVFGNLAITLPLGVGLAWLVCRYEFWGRYWFERLLIVPIAMPPYILAFILLDVFDVTGEINAQLRASGILIDVDAHSRMFVVLAMSLVTYPYIFILTNVSFRQLQNSLLERGSILGMSNLKIFWFVVVPLTRPAIFAGAALVVMETLSDFGAVSMFNYETLTTLVYKTWFSLFDLQTAIQIASLLLGLVIVVATSVQLLKSKKSFYNVHQNQEHTLYRLQLTGNANVFAGLLCLSVLLVSSFLPIAALLFMAFNQFDFNPTLALQETIEPLINSLLIGTLAAVFIVAVSFMLTVMRFEMKARLFIRKRVLRTVLNLLLSIGSLGYAIPGTVLAVSFLGLLFAISNGINGLFGLELNLMYILNQGIWGLLIIYTIRFLVVSNNVLLSALSRLKPSTLDVAQTLGMTRDKLIFQVYLRYLRVSCLSAGGLIFVEVIKEMPATLMLRPFGWDTLSVKIFSLTREAQWGQAAVPSLLLVTLSLLAIFFLLPNHKTNTVKS